MNKTFQINHENNKINSFSQGLNEPIYPTIFKNFEIDEDKNKDTFYLKLYQNKNKIVLPKYKNISKVLIKSKKQFRNLFNIKNTIFKEILTKDNSITYQNFIHGFGERFFGPFGLITKNNKFLRESYFLNSFNDKIFAGKLDYYDDEYLIHFNRYKQRLNNSKKLLLSISKNYAVVNEKNDLYSMKAITSKKLYNKNKNFVSLNKHRNRNIMTEINKSSEKNKKIFPFNTTIYKSKCYKNKFKHNSKSLCGVSLNLKKNLKNYNIFYRNKNLFNNYKQSILTMKKTNNKKIMNLTNKDKTSNDSYTTTFTKKTNNSNYSSSNFFMTQTSSFNGNNKFKNKKIIFNRISNLKRNEKSLNIFIKKNLKNVS